MPNPAHASLLETLVTRAASVVGVPHGFLYVETPEGSELERKVLVGTESAGFRVRANEGVVGRVWKSGQALTLDGVIGVPLRSGPNVVGVLGLARDRDSAREFGDDDVRQLSGFVQLASIALDNTRFFETEHAAREQAERLLAAARALTVTMDLPSVLASILRELRQVVPYDSASVQELRGDRLVIVGGYGFARPESVMDVSIDFASGAYPNVEEVVRTRAPLVLDDAWHTYPGFRNGPHAQAGVRSWLGVPLLFGERLVGILTLDMKEPGFYTGAHARLAQAFASQAVVAMENARLYSAAQKSEERSRFIVETAHDAFVSMDVEGRITGWNAQAERTFGWTATEAIGRPLADTIVPIIYREAHRNGLARFLTSGEGPVLGRRLELTALHRNGQEFPVELTISAIRFGEDQLFHAFVRDISERRNVDQLREDLTRTIVHDLRNPLTVTLGFLELLATSPGSLPPTQAALLSGAVRGARNALELINEILDVSRLQKGPMPVEKERLLVSDLVAEIVDLEAPLAHEKALRLVQDVPDGLPAAWADPALVFRVLQNLVGNAIKFTPEGGLVRICARLEPGAPHMLRVSVADNGPGIAAEMRERIFETFVTGRLERRGSGLGLAFCRLAVEAHGGRIWVESEPGQGAAFCFTLPVQGPG